MRRRIVGAQGAVQLISAIVAMRSQPEDTIGNAAADGVENVLVIHDLSTTPEQGVEFAECLRELAGLCESWTRIVYIDSEASATLQKQLKTGGWEKATETLKSWLGCSDADELLLGQNLLFLNHLLAQAFSDADKSCYGDGLAINFSAEYYSPDHNPIMRAAGSSQSSSTRRGTRRGVMRWFAPWGKWGRDSEGNASKSPPLKPLAKEKYRVAFSRKYLLFPNMLDEQWLNYVQLSPAPFVDLFQQIASELHRFDQGNCEQLADRVAEADQTIVVLSSNFSETKRMELDGEIECYQQWVQSVRTSDNPLLVIKPHPRDSYGKIEQIRQKFTLAGYRVEVLADPWTFYVPFESIYLRYIQPRLRNRQRLDIICTSSACLSLEYLFGQQCHLGFGSEQVERFFATQWKPLRQLHETDLHRLIEHSRSGYRILSAA
jgi:hypothetical protein